MAEYGQTLAHGAGQSGGSSGGTVGDFSASLSRIFSDTYGSLDAGLHQFLPAAVPTWLVIGIAMVALTYWVIRR